MWIQYHLNQSTFGYFHLMEVTRWKWQDWCAKMKVTRQKQQFEIHFNQSVSCKKSLGFKWKCQNHFIRGPQLDLFRPIFVHVAFICLYYHHRYYFWHLCRGSMYLPSFWCHCFIYYYFVDCWERSKQADGCGDKHGEQPWAENRGS